MKLLLTSLLCTSSLCGFALTVSESRGVHWICGEDGARIVGVGPVRVRQKGWTCDLAASASVDRVTFTFTAKGGEDHSRGWTFRTPLAKDARKIETVEKLGRWRRFDADPDAEPMEHPLGKFKVIESPHGRLMYGIVGNENWCGRDHESVEFPDKGPPVRKLTFVLMRPGEAPYECAARLKGLPFALGIATDRRNNIFAENAAELEFAFTETAGRDVQGEPLELTVRDWDGQEVFAKRGRMSLGANQRKSAKVPLALPGRGLYFVEAALGGEFTRTTVAVIPPFEFGHRDESVIGLNMRCGRVFKDEKEQEYALVSRLGISYLRSGDNRLAKRFGMTAGFSSQMPKTDYRAGDPASERQVAEWLDTIAQLESPVFEFGNEIGHYCDMPTRHVLYDRYSVWLDAIRAGRTKRGMDFKILYGTSARRPELVRLIAEKGIFDRLDLLVVHPGRLNWTSDLYGKGWRYLGLVRDSRLLYAEVGQKGKPIYLTETYTKTRPNDCHSDSLRQSAENAVLNVVLAMAEGCRRLCIYQLHEGVSYDENGIDLSDTEYSYGILNRDNSLKPSAIAYETAAEELDGARFVRWIGRDGTKLNGCLFTTPKGPLAVLWDRTEGYDLRTQGPRPRVKGATFFHFEPWLENWRVKTPYAFKADAAKVTLRDAIGRTVEMPAKGGGVRLELTGAPVFVRGLSERQFENWKPSGTAENPVADEYEKNAKLY